MDEPAGTDPDDRRQHLAFIQAIVTRMSAASASAKGWLLPVVTLTYGYALTRSADSVALLGIAAVLVFALLDANYLNQERAFRALYDLAASGDPTPALSLNPSLAAPAREPFTGSWLKRAAQAIGRWVPPFTVWRSWAIAPFYGPLVLVGLVIFIRVR